MGFKKVIESLKPKGKIAKTIELKRDTYTKPWKLCSCAGSGFNASHQPFLRTRKQWRMVRLPKTVTQCFMEEEYPSKQ